MHHFIYPSQDTFITNQTEDNQNVLNYGLDEILIVGTDSKTISNISSTTNILYETQSVSNWCATLFTGLISNGTMVITASSVIGTSSFVTGSDSFISNISSSITGSLTNFSGSIWSFTGQVIDLSGRIITGSIAGVDTILLPHRYVTSSFSLNRSLVQFNIDAISRSISSRDISNPHFTLKLKVARAENLPVQYSLWAYPIAESWVMGNGYMSDSGSSMGASWTYRDHDFGTTWAMDGGSITVPVASQSFNYEVGDVAMDVTDIVNSWLDGTNINYGFLVKSGDENAVTSSGMMLRFFSNDSNTIYRPVLDVAWDDSIFITGSVSTGSITLDSIPAGITASVVGSPSISRSDVNGYIAGLANLFISNQTASGTVDASGQNGTVSDLHIFGHVSGSIIQSASAVVTVIGGTGGAYGTSVPVATNVMTTSVLLGTMLDGFYSSSIVTASIFNNVQITGTITGSWNPNLLIGTSISGSFPFLNYPDMIVTLSGSFINASAYGYVNSYISNSGIFTGTITDGPFMGSYVTLPFSGSISFTSSFFTSSVELVSSSLDPVQLNQPFAAIIQNLKPTVQAGNVIRINVFGREEFPLKNFARSTQFSQFLIPKYLPVSSSYSIKDNQTEEILVDFDNYTRLSCDMNGNYFLLDTTGLPQERYFKILIRIEQSGSVYTLDNDNIFKIVR